LTKKTTTFLHWPDFYGLLFAKILQKNTELGLSQRLIGAHPPVLQKGVVDKAIRVSLRSPKKSSAFGQGLTVLLVPQPTVNCGGFSSEGAKGADQELLKI
jgi:hypothetical protein